MEGVLELAYAYENSMEDSMSEAGLSLGDIPDLSGIDDNQPAAWEDGWYEGVIVGKRESTDAPAQSGDSRNIRLQVALKRQSDGREMNLSTLINYQPEDLTQETIQKVAAQKEKVKAGDDKWGSLFRPFMSLVRLGKLQKIAGVRQLQRDDNGALNLAPLFGKRGYFKVEPDDRNSQYKQISDMREDKPRKAAVL